MIGHVLDSTNEIITQNYSESHKAIDMVGSGNNVIAYDDGVVEIVVKRYKGPNNKSRGLASYGNYIKIKHSNGMKTLYAHMKYGSIKVSKGEYVSKGQILGTMGTTGNSYGVHLHFEVRTSNDIRVNPYNHLWKTAVEVVDNKEEEKVINTEPIKEKNEAKEEKTIDIAEKEKQEEVHNNTETIVIENEKVLENTSQPTSSFKKIKYTGRSLVDALKSISVNDNFEYRVVLASKNGIVNYTGSYNQNLQLLNLLKQGKLKKAY